MTTVDLSANGSYMLDVALVFIGDQVPSNDTSSKELVSGAITAFPYNENFDGVIPNINGGTLTANINVPEGWTNDPTDGLDDWYPNMGTTTSTLPGPSGDHTPGSGGNGVYMFIEDSITFNEPVISLITPCFDVSALANPTLEFYYHGHNFNTATPLANTNLFSVDVISYPGGIVTMDAFGPIGQSPIGWVKQSLNLSPFVGSISKGISYLITLA